MNQSTVLRSSIGVLLLGLLGLGSPAIVWAETEAEETQLKTEQQEIDNEAPAKTEQERIDALAKQFDVPASSVEELRNKGQGWGEVTIELSMAQHLSKTDPGTYPKLSDALTKIESLRSEGKGWGNISKELGFKLGPVISEARHTRQEFQADKAGKPERAERGSRLDRPGRPERLDKLDKPDRPAIPERSQRPGR